MSDSYDKTLERILRYREEHKLSQREMGDLMGITQSHYSKLELRKKIISGKTLLKLDDKEWDIDYIITGEKSQQSELNQLLEECSEDKRAEFIKLIVWTVTQGQHNKKERSSKEEVQYNREIEILQRQFKRQVEDKNSWVSIRKTDRLTQNQMADLLSINIKKYREIEKGNQIADAEILSRLYDKTGYPPSLVLSAEVTNLNVLNRIWLTFEEEKKQELLKFLRMGLDILNQNSEV